MTLIKASIVGTDDLRRRLNELNPEVNTAIIRKSLIEGALEIQANAAKVQIAGGGGGKRNARPPLPDRLTSRTGHLRGDIKVDRLPLPRAIEVGPDEFYGAIHEFGLGRYPVRAFMQPALGAVSPRFPEIIVKHWKREAKI